MPRRTLTKRERRELKIRLSNAFERAERKKYYKVMGAKSALEKRATLRRVRTAIDAEVKRLENRDPKTGRVRGVHVDGKWAKIAKGQANIESAGKTMHYSQAAGWIAVDSKGRTIKETRGRTIKWYRRGEQRGRRRVPVGGRVPAANVRRSRKMSQYWAEVRMVRDSAGVSTAKARGMVRDHVLWLTPKEKRAMSQKIRRALDLGDKE
jgi:hypothetical protein